MGVDVGDVEVFGEVGEVGVVYVGVVDEGEEFGVVRMWECENVRMWIWFYWLDIK